MASGLGTDPTMRAATGTSSVAAPTCTMANKCLTSDRRWRHGRRGLKATREGNAALYDFTVHPSSGGGTHCPRRVQCDGLGLTCF
jgi:hypothetical protein